MSFTEKTQVFFFLVFGRKGISKLQGLQRQQAMHQLRNVTISYFIRWLQTFDISWNPQMSMNSIQKSHGIHHRYCLEHNTKKEYIFTSSISIKDVHKVSES